MKPVATKVLVASFVLIYAGCSSGSGPGATPEETFENMKTAIIKKDWKGMAAQISPQTLQGMIGGIAMMAAVPTEGEKPPQGLRDILTKHGVKLLDEATLKESLAESKKELALRAQMSAGVKDPVACLGDVFEWMDKNAKDDAEFNRFRKEFSKESASASKLTDVKIDGDQAVAKVVKDGSESGMRFKRIDHRWYFDLGAPR